MLDEMVAAARRRAPRDASAERLKAEAATLSSPRHFAEALRAPGLTVVAEVKRRSPSAGVLGSGLDPARQATRYVSGGAGAVSVLTDPQFFDGSLEDVGLVHAAVPVPVLRKDFVVEAGQVWESRLAGADAVLLVVAALSAAELAGLLEETRRAGMEALVEVHDERDVSRALEVGSPIVGVNNRDLRTLEVDLSTAERLVLMLEGVVRVAESGISTPDHARRMSEAGFDAVLVGESLMRSDDPGALVASLREAGTS